MARFRTNEVVGSPISLGHTKYGIGSQTNYTYRDYSKSECLDSIHPNFPYEGSGLNISSCSITRTPSANRLKIANANYNHDVRFIPSYFSQAYTPAMPNWSLDTSVQGAEGWKKYRPGQSVVELGQFLAELRDIPSIPLKQILKARSSLDAMRKLGSEYLNVEFGWAPLLSDLRKIYHLSESLDKRLKQLRRDNGQNVRRRGKIRSYNNVTLTQSTVPTLYPSLTSIFYVDPLARGQRNLTQSSGRDSWFSARFRYFIEDIESPHWENRARRALFGLNPTPSLLWEVLPWSWLIDWGVNVGTVLSNMSTNAADNLAAKYAFVMETAWIREEVSERNNLTLNGGATVLPFYAEAKMERITKVRQAASPYGFGITPDSLSSRQALILSALGISRRW